MARTCANCGSALSDLNEACPSCRTATQSGSGLGPLPSPETAALPSTFGPYRVTGRLGRGGMGEVLKAVDERNGRVVAIKRISGVSRGRLARLRREARTIAELDRTGIVRIHDVGESGSPWFAMELIDGVPLGEAFSEDPLGPGWLARLKQAVDQILRALDALHGAGIVHRDIKPGNVLVRRDGRVKIVDLGLVHVQDSSLTVSGHVIGSFAYISPEQALGRPVDARSDLYSLGAMLYGLLTGQAPFGASGGATLLLQHVYHDPPPLRQIEPQVPEAWEQFVLRLMAKRPERRFQSAVGALHVLEGLPPESPFSALPVFEARSGHSVTLRAGHAPSLLARKATIDCLEGAAREALSGRGGLLVLSGRAGVGKSRLLGEMAGVALRSEAICLNLPTREDSGLELLAPALEAIAAELNRVRDPARARLATSAAQLAVGLRRSGEPDPALSEELREFLFEVSRSLFLMLVVDDLDAASPALGRFLVALGRRAQKGVPSGPQRRAWARLLIVASVRHEGTGWLDTTSPGVTLVRVPPLDFGGIRALLAGMFPGLPHLEALSLRVATGTEGNPAAVREIACGLVAAGAVIPAPNGWRFAPSLLAGNTDPEAAVAALDLPEPAEALASRLHELSPDQTALLTRAARYRTAFDIDELAPGHGSDSDLEAIDALVRDGLLVELDSGTIRRPSHLLLEALAKLPEDAPDDTIELPRPAELSAEAGGDEARARACLSRNAPARALTHAEAARRQARAARSLSAEAAAVTLQGEALRLLGRRGEATEALHQALKLASQAPDGGVTLEGEALVALARLATEDGLVGRALGLAREAAELFDRSGYLPGQVLARIERGRAYLKLADGPRAQRALAEATGLATRSASTRLVIRASNGLGRSLHLQGDLHGALQILDQGLRIEACDLDVLAALQVARAHVLSELGQLGAGRSAAKAAREAAGNEFAPPLGAELCVAEAACAETPREARACAEEALARARFCARDDLIAHALLVLSRATDRRDPSYAAAALRAACEGQDTILELWARIELSRVLRAVGQAADATREERLADALGARLAALQGAAAVAFRHRPRLSL